MQRAFSLTYHSLCDRIIIDNFFRQRTVMGGLFMKLGRLLAFILSSAVSCCVCTPVQYSSAEGGKYLLGDVDGDGKVSSVDASAVLAEYAAISGGNEPAFSEVQFRAADITRDGKTDSVDASQILSYYAYLSTGGTLIMEDYLAQPPVTTTLTTSSATTIVTTTTSVTTTVPEKYIINGYSKYDLLSSDNEKAASAYKALGDQLWIELTNKHNYFFNYGLSNGHAECYVMLAILNHEQGISPEVLAQDDILGNYSLEEIKNYSQWIELELIEEAYETRVDYSKYIIDEEFANFISRTNEAWRNYENGDEEEYLNITRDYSSNDFVKECYFYSTNANCYNSSNSDLESYEITLSDYYANIVEPMYYNYQQYVGKS